MAESSESLRDKYTRSQVTTGHEGDEIPLCSQTVCKKAAQYRYTWPGQNESFICGEHVDKLRNVAEAMGFPLEVIRL